MAESSIGWLHWPNMFRIVPAGSEPGLPGYTVNYWHGCAKVDPECKFCYAEREAERGRLAVFLQARRGGLPVWGQRAPRHIVGNATLSPMRRWNREAEAACMPRLVFGGSQMDWLEDREDLAEARSRMLAAIGETPWLRWILLTKRPQNFARLVPAWAECGVPKNVWFGISAGSQTSLDSKLEAFAAVPAEVKLISGEPLIERVDWRRALRVPGMQWLILGGESGARDKVRPLHTSWICEGIEQARTAGVAVYVKQLGSRVRTGTAFEHALHLHHRKGEDPLEWPDGLAVQEWPGGGAFVYGRAA